jgi:MarR family 2-MHQ and catechol resistance regulon transcriptional repressor
MNNSKFDSISENLMQIGISLMSIYKRESHVKPLVHDPTYMILGLLSWRDMPMSEIGKKLCRSKPNMTALVEKMINDGLVKRIDDKDDRRIINISITKKGMNLLREKKDEMKQTLKIGLERLDKKDVDNLHDALEKVNLIFNKESEYVKNKKY